MRQLTNRERIWQKARLLFLENNSSRLGTPARRSPVAARKNPVCNENRQYPRGLVIARTGRIFVPVIASIILAQMGLAQPPRAGGDVPTPASTMVVDPELVQDPAVPGTPPPAPTPTPPPSPVTPPPPLPPLPETNERPRIIIPKPPAPVVPADKPAAPAAELPAIVGDTAVGAMRFINVRRELGLGLLPELPPGPAIPQ